MVDFNRRRPISSGIIRGREKEEEGEPEVRHRSSPAGDFFSPCGEKKRLLALGEGTRRCGRSRKKKKEEKQWRSDSDNSEGKGIICEKRTHVSKP
ncbi:hypothetical protein BHM03_00032798 [Ensete ventricosum]|nr:hypothetical protein BHM03_00032798 [Ensete ventricosum]